MRRYLPFIPIIILVILFFVLGSLAHGETLLYYQNTTSTAQDTGLQNFWQKLGKGLTGNISKINFYYDTCLTDAYFALKSNTINNVSGATNQIFFTTGMGGGSCVDKGDYVELTTTSTYQLDPNLYYILAFASRNTGDNYVYGSATTSSYPNGILCKHTDCELWPVLNAGFQIYTDEPVNYINFSIPTTTTTKDFDYWQLSYGFADGTPIGEGSPDTGRIDVIYTGENTDSSNIFAWASSTAILAKTWALGYGNWSATAYLYTSSSVLVASSTINFTISEFSGFFTLPTSTIPTATSSCVSGNFFENGLCYLFNAMLVPSQSSVNRFVNLKATIISKPPVGYFYAVKDVISGFATTTATSTIPLQSLEPLKTGFLGDLRNGLQWLLWIVFLFWIFNRLRHLQL